MPISKDYHDKMEELAQKLGIANLARLVPVGAKQVKQALATGDDFLNTISLDVWDAQHYNVLNLARGVRLPSWSMSNSVGVLKHVAREHQDQLLMKDKLFLGKCDGYDNGRKVCEAYISWEYDPHKGTFSMQAEVWNSRKTDIIMGGQCVDGVADMFPGNAIVQRMVEIWKECHLNDLQAGSPEQMAYLKEHESEWEAEKANGATHYDWAKRTLESAGLQPDPNCNKDGTPKKFNQGSKGVLKNIYKNMLRNEVYSVECLKNQIKIVEEKLQGAKQHSRLRSHLEQLQTWLPYVEKHGLLPEVKTAAVPTEESLMASYYNTNTYSYGSAWLKKELPAEVIQEILSWSEPAKEAFADKSHPSPKAVNDAIGAAVGAKGVVALKDAAENDVSTDREPEHEAE